MALLYIVFVSIYILLASDSTLAQHTGQEMSLREKAVHHYNQLLRTLIEIKKTGMENLPTTLGAATGNTKDDDISSLILSSLLASCPTVQNNGEGSVTNLNIFNNATVSFSLRDKKKKSDKSSVSDKESGRSSTDDQVSTSEFRQFPKSSEELSPWVENLVRPINFTLKREGDLVRVTFDVLRTKPAVVSRTWTFEGERKYMKGPADYGLDAGQPISSPIDFVFNASGCPPTSASLLKREHFAFSKRSTSLDVVIFIMPTCILDVMNGMRENADKEIEWNGQENEYDQTLYYPNFLNTMNTPPIQTLLGKNVTFDIQVAMGEEDDMMIEGIFYNATSDTMLISDISFLQLSNREIYIQSFESPQKVKLFDIKVLDQKQINGSIPGIKYKKELNGDGTLYYVSATLEVTLMTADEDMSGMLYFQHKFKLPLNRQDSSSLLSLSVVKTVPILRPNQTEAIPKGKYLTHTKQKFRCDDHGFSYHQGYGDNCTFFCTIVGTGIKDIRVKKVSGDITPVQKYAEVNSHNAVLFVNLGPTRKQFDGEYECSVKEIGGKRHKWRVTVGTWGFPEVKEATLVVQNESATFVCVVDSERPVNVSTSLHIGRKTHSIDGKPNVTRSLHKRGNETRMEVTFPTSYLRWPKEFLACEVENEVGSDLSLESLNRDRISDYYYQTGHPFLLRDESSVIDQRDGVAIVKCVAEGKDPLEINFLFNPLSNKEEIVKNNSMNIISTARDGDKTTTILKIPTASLKWPRHTISCRAENEYGKDAIDFELSKVIYDYF